jgi:hypothetical protein
VSDETDVLARDLREATANLAAFIEARAQEIAAPWIEAAERAAANSVAEMQERLDFQTRRQDDVIAELRRQVDVQRRWQERHVRERCVPAEAPGQVAR